MKEGSGHILDRNRAAKNLEDGIDVQKDSQDVQVLNNRVVDNFGVGIEISEGAEATEVRGNRTDDNRVDFCDEGIGTNLGANDFAVIDACIIGD